jgi:hypothetical protein
VIVKNLFIMLYSYNTAEGSRAGAVRVFALTAAEASVVGVRHVTAEPDYPTWSNVQYGPAEPMDRELLKAQMGLVEATPEETK